jgi:hypothetical protein
VELSSRQEAKMSGKSDTARPKNSFFIKPFLIEIVSA